MRNRQAALIFILVTVTLDILAMGLIIPVLPKLILDFLGGKMTSATNWSTWFTAVFALMQFFCSPILGVLSDRIGRRPIILLSNLGLGLDYIVMALAPSISWLFIGRIISGITTSSIPTAMAYIADVTTKEKRAAAFGMIGIAFGIGFAFGPVIGGILGNFNPRFAFWFAAALSLTNWLWGYFFVPESLPDERRRHFELRRANPVGSLRILRSHPELWRLTTIQFLAYTAHNVFSVWVLYAIYRYNWSELTNGISLMVVGIVTAIISGGLTGPMVKRFGEKKTLYTGQFFGASGMLIAGLARTGAWLFGSIPIISLWNISMPAAQSMMTHRVSEKEQGELQGAIQSMRSITFIIGPILFLQTFRWFIDPKHSVHIPGAPYYLAAALLFTAMLMSTRIKETRVVSTETAASPPEAPPEMTATGAAPIASQENI
ncbi:MAG TPA: TCR/Tet family MFS transporter [Chthoniobacterales bacterium]|jgi:MFS transporter, DHA1 family, tetracycline resistance protein|nr:TCR/Tet family MFS transporter [Chthoniobacterales bacterium]